MITVLLMEEGMEILLYVRKVIVAGFLQTETFFPRSVAVLTSARTLLAFKVAL